MLPYRVLFVILAVVGPRMLLAASSLPEEAITTDSEPVDPPKLTIPPTTGAFFVETFQGDVDFTGSPWFISKNEKYTQDKVSISTSDKLPGIYKQDKALVLEENAKHYGIAAQLPSVFEMDATKGRELVIQYEVRLERGLDCGGAYIKLLKDDVALDIPSFHDKTPFVIMFGPDKCGVDNKVHFIFRHQNPKTMKWEEKHMENPVAPRTDRKSHLYTLIIRDDNRFEVLVDLESKKTGSLFEDFKPPVNPPKEVDDPEDTKPEDWVDSKKIPDPESKKPDDWDETEPEMIEDPSAKKPAKWLDDEPEMIEDPKAKKPEDWDEEEDGKYEAPVIENPKCEPVGCGEWKAPLVKNPKYKGKWTAPLVDNPEYKGEWKPRQISNPDYFEDANPSKMAPIAALAIEVWTMTGGITFDNFWLGHSSVDARKFAEKTWEVKAQAEKDAEKAAAEEERQKNKNAQWESGNVIDRFGFYMEDLSEWVNERRTERLILIGVSLVVFLVLFLYCCIAVDPETAASMKDEMEDEVLRREKKDAEEDEDVEEDEDDNDDDEEEEQEEKSEVISDKKEEEPKVRQRKRAPKAD